MGPRRAVSSGWAWATARGEAAWNVNPQVGRGVRDYRDMPSSTAPDLPPPDPADAVPPTPPPSVHDAMAVAAHSYDRLAAAGWFVHFRLHAAARRSYEWAATAIAS